MFKETIQNLAQKIERIENQFDEFDIDDIGSDEFEALEEEVYEIENEIADCIDNVDEFEYNQLRKLQKKIAQIKKDNDFFDEEATLNAMFPNKDDED